MENRVFKTSTAAVLLIPLLMLASILAPRAHDDGRYAQSPFRSWFESLRSKRGLCCGEADGHETDYDMRDGKYWVPLRGTWTQVPDDAVLTEPNKYGRAVVWTDGAGFIRCFIAGSGS